VADTHRRRRVQGMVTPVRPMTRSLVARGRRWLGGSFAPYLYVTPFFAVFFAFFVYPVAYSFRVSLYHWTGLGPMRYVGFGNYVFVLGDNYWWTAVAVTGIFWVLTIPLGTTLSLILAVACNRPRFRGRSLARVLYLLPAVSSIVAVSVLFRVLFDEQFGPINVVLGALHLPHIPWLTNGAWSKVAIGIVRLWESVGLTGLFFSAALEALPAEVYDAAAVDGCGPMRQFWFITVPLLVRTILFVTVIGTLAIFGIFAEPQLITGGGPGTSTTTMALYLYQMLQGLDLGTASAVSFLMTVLMMSVSILLFLAARRWRLD